MKKIISIGILCLLIAVLFLGGCEEKESGLLEVNLYDNEGNLIKSTSRLPTMAVINDIPDVKYIEISVGMKNEGNIELKRPLLSFAGHKNIVDSFYSTTLKCIQLPFTGCSGASIQCVPDLSLQFARLQCSKDKLNIDERVYIKTKMIDIDEIEEGEHVLLAIAYALYEDNHGNQKDIHSKSEKVIRIKKDSPICGDGKCELGETALNCPVDCGGQVCCRTGAVIPNPVYSYNWESECSAPIKDGHPIVGVSYTIVDDSFCEEPTESGFIGKPTFSPARVELGESIKVTQTFYASKEGDYFLEAGAEFISAYVPMALFTIEENVCNEGEDWYANQNIHLTKRKHDIVFKVIPSKNKEGQFVVHTAWVEKCGGDLIKPISISDEKLIISKSIKPEISVDIGTSSDIPPPPCRWECPIDMVLKGEMCIAKPLPSLGNLPVITCLQGAHNANTGYCESPAIKICIEG